MKPTNSKLITVAAVIAIFIISSFAYLFYFSKDKTFPSSGSSSESEDKEPDEENTNEDTFNTYPVYPVGTVYGSLQRLGCSANDEILQSYLIGGFVYVIFYSESADYDSRSKNSVGVAKLDGNGVLLGALSLTDEDYKKNAAPVYLASRPVWNGIAVYISFADSASSAIFYVGFEPEIISVRYFDGAGGASYMYFSGDKLYLFGVSENIISVKIFSESFDAPASKTAALPAFCDIFSVYNAANAFYIALNSASGFYIYSFTDKFLNVSFGNVRISQILPSPEGYVITGENSGVLLTYTSKFIKTSEYSFDGIISNVQKTQFGYLLITSDENLSVVYFLCPHFDILFRENRSDNLKAFALASSVYLYSLDENSLNIYSVSNFVITGYLSVAAENPKNLSVVYDKSSAFIILSANGISNQDGYGGADIFILTVTL